MLNKSSLWWRCLGQLLALFLCGNSAVAQVSLGQQAVRDAFLREGKATSLYPHILTVMLCDAENAGSKDPLELIVHTAAGEKRSSLGSFATTPGEVYHRPLFVGAIPVNPEDMRAVTISKQGTDAVCLQYVQISDADKIIWYWGGWNGGPDARNYVGATDLWPVWIDDGAAPKTKSIRFSDISLPYTNISDQRPASLVTTTCTAAVDANAGTNDAVEAVLKHEGLEEHIVLDTPSKNDREPGQTDTYTLDEHGLRRIDSLKLTKRGSDRWCIATAELFVGGKSIKKWTGPFKIDDDTADAPSPTLSLGALTVGPSTTTKTGYVGLPFKRGRWYQGVSYKPCRPCEGTTIIDIATCDRCNTGLVCNPDKICEMAGAEGQRCAETELLFGGGSTPDCNAGLICNGDRCYPPSVEHAACTAKADCSGTMLCGPQKTCERIETLYGNFGGEVLCQGDDCNYCVNDVVKQFRSLSNATRVKGNYTNYGLIDELPELEKLPDQHVQSFTAINNGGSLWYFGTVNDEKQAEVYAISSGGAKYRVYHAKGDHPGGTSAIGNYLAVARENPASVDVYDMSDPMNAPEPTQFTFRHSTFDQAGQDACDAYGGSPYSGGCTGATSERVDLDRIASVGTARLANGKILFLANRSSTCRAEYQYYAFTVDDLEGGGYTPVGKDEDVPVGAENLTLLTECGTGRIYAVAATAEEHFASCSEGSGTYSDDVNNELHLFRLDPSGSSFNMTHIDFSSAPPFSEGCNARAAGSFQVLYNNKLRFHCHEKLVTSRDPEDDHKMDFEAWTVP